MQIFFFSPGPTARGSDVIGLVSGPGHEGFKKLSSDSQEETYSSQQIQCVKNLGHQRRQIGGFNSQKLCQFFQVFCEEHFQADYGSFFFPGPDSKYFFTLWTYSLCCSTQLCPGRVKAAVKKILKNEHACVPGKSIHKTR